MGAILPRRMDERNDDTKEMRDVCFHSFGYFWCHLLICGPLNLWKSVSFVVTFRELATIRDVLCYR